MTWDRIKRAAIQRAALEVIGDSASHPLDVEAAERSMRVQSNYALLTDYELDLVERLQRRANGEDVPPLVKPAPAPIVAHAARCTRCEGLTDADLAELREVLAEPDQDLDQATEQADPQANSQGDPG